MKPLPSTGGRLRIQSQGQELPPFSTVGRPVPRDAGDCRVRWRRLSPRHRFHNISIGIASPFRDYPHGPPWLGNRSTWSAASAWLQSLIAEGNLSTRSIRHAHGVLRTALNHAAAIEIVPSNVATIIRAPALVKPDIQILTSDQVTDALRKLS